MKKQRKASLGEKHVMDRTGWTLDNIRNSVYCVAERREARRIDNIIRSERNKAAWEGYSMACTGGDIEAIYGPHPRSRR